MYFDSTYLLFVMPAFLFSLWASSRVKSTFKKYERQYSARGLRGFEAARRILDLNGLRDVQVERVSGHLTDHYDPRTRVIRLSASVYDSSSTAAIGVAAHEAGHAVQHGEGYVPLKLRNAIIPVTNFGSKLSMPLFILGLFLAALDGRFLLLSYLGLLAFGLCVLFQLFTLPTEFDASRRALAALDQGGVLNTEELQGAKKVLWAAAMTYVAALAVALAQMLHLLSVLGRRN